MTRTQLFDPATGKILIGGEELIDRWKNLASAIIWVDLQDNPIKEERQMLKSAFGLHPLAVEDAQRQRHPPKLEKFDGYFFILLKALNAQTENIHFGTIQLAIFSAERFLVTRHTAESVSTDRLWQRVTENNRLFSRGTQWLALELSRLVVSRYLDVVLTLEPRLEELEDEVLLNPRDSLLHELSGYKTNLKKIRRFLAYQVQLFEELRDNADYYEVADALKHDVIDIYEKLERAYSLTTLYHELATDLMDSYISLASHHLNNIMKILTTVTVIFVPLSLIAGIYGMNFENMPELRSRYGYFVVLGIMISMIALLLLLFRKIRWL